PASEPLGRLVEPALPLALLGLVYLAHLSYPSALAPAPEPLTLDQSLSGRGQYRCAVAIVQYPGAHGPAYGLTAGGDGVRLHGCELALQLLYERTALGQHVLALKGGVLELARSRRRWHLSQVGRHPSRCEKAGRAAVVLAAPVVQAG